LDAVDGSVAGEECVLEDAAGVGDVVGVGVEALFPPVCPGCDVGFREPLGCGLEGGVGVAVAVEFERPPFPPELEELQRGFVVVFGEGLGAFPGEVEAFGGVVAVGPGFLVGDGCVLDECFAAGDVVVVGVVVCLVVEHVGEALDFAEVDRGLELQVDVAHAGRHPAS
jgi:hypothetical protein